LKFKTLKTKISILLLALTLTLLLVACGETTATSPAGGSNGAQTTAAQTTPANGKATATTSPATTSAAQTTAPAKSSGGDSTGGTASGDSAGSSVCGLFDQAEAEAVMGTKLEKKPSEDSPAFNTCFYSTLDDGSLKIKDISHLSVMVFTNQVTPAWYASVKRSYQEQTPNNTLTQVEGIGNDAFSYVSTDHFTDGKTINLGVLQNKTFFLVTVSNTQMDEAAQTAKMKELALKIAAGL